jgi:hypothetical protein
MEEKNNSHTLNSHYYDGIDIVDLLKTIVAGKWVIFSITAIASTLGVIYSLSLPNIYESKALLVSVSSSNNPTISQQYSRLASFAGVNNLSEDSSSNAMQALEKMKSLSFFEANILPNISLPDLMAYKSWNPHTNLSEYDEDIYDDTSKLWLSNPSNKDLMPSSQKSFNAFKGHLSMQVDQITGFLTLKIRHQSPYIAKEWNSLIIDQINDFYRKKDKDEAKIAVNYFNDRIAETNFSEIKQVIAMLMKEETQKLALVEAKEFYVYEYIDPPVVMEKKSEPSRALICIVFALFGGILSVTIVLVRRYA